MSKLAENLYAATGWTPEDVIKEAESRGKLMTREQAIELLDKWSEDIVSRMTERGWDVISTAITMDYPDLPLLPGILGEEESGEEMASQNLAS